jgi:hypothetical protein
MYIQQLTEIILLPVQNIVGICKGRVTQIIQNAMQEMNSILNKRKPEQFPQMAALLES